jgi:hypothetical protein
MLSWYEASVELFFDFDWKNFSLSKTRKNLSLLKNL